MKSMIALIKREYLEHRGAFLIAPAVILVILTLVAVTGIAFHRVRVIYEIGMPSALKFFEFGLMGVSGLWLVYLMAALFFYYADAFSADRRNNAMLFWKSMPISDFQVLASKMLAGMTLFPALIFGALVLSGIVLYGGTVAGAAMVPGLSLPGVGEVLVSAFNIALFALIYLALALLWYAPFFAWVGALSTVFRRWSIPLAFLIPGLVGLVENLLFSDTGPRPGYFLDYIINRFAFGPDRKEAIFAFFADRPFDSGGLLASLITRIDWAQLGGGLIVAALLVYAASEYRRRVIST